LLRVRLRSKASPVEQRANALVDDGCQAKDIVVLRRRQRMKPGTAIVIGRINPIDHHRVEVYVGVQGVPRNAE
jgi:hypothetical protein